MGPQDRQWLFGLTRRLLTRARTAVRPLIPSETLREALEVHLDPFEPQGYLEIPHYWAIYVHDGRGPFGPRRAKVLVWFTNPEDDPRLRPPPVRYAQWRPLTKAEFQHGLQRNAEHRLLGLPPYMIVRRYQPRPQPPTYFFSLGLKPFEQQIVPPIVLETVANFVARVARDLTPQNQKPILLRLR